MGEETRPDRDASRRHFVQMLVVFAVASAIGIALGLWIDWFPAAASTQAGPIDTLWDVLLIVSVPIFVLVTVTIVYAVALFRRRPGEEDLDGPPIHGSTRLEVIWTAAPTALIVALIAYAWIVLVDIEAAPAGQEGRGNVAAPGQEAPAGERRVGVVGEQFTWTFRYKEGGQEFSSNVLHLPAGESVQFDIETRDVIHSFWVPEFRLKIDAVPGITTGYRVTPKADAIGRYPIVCAELCGIGHAYMRQTAVVQSPEDFDAWVQRMTAPTEDGAAEGEGTEEAAGEVDGREVFVAGNPDSGAMACGACHTLADANTTAQTGPDLDKTMQGWDAERIRRAIVDPEAEIAEGFQAGLMPNNYDETLSDAQLTALVDYLVEATK